MINILKGDYHHLRNLGALPVSSEGEGSPIIWPISETNDSTKITYNNNLKMIDTLKERLPSPQKLGCAACKL